MREGHWSFNKHLELMNEVDESQQIHHIQISETQFWLWLHDLPLWARNAYVGKRVGTKIGRVEDVDLDEGELAWREFMQVQVTLDVTKPLLQGTKFAKGEEAPA